MKFKLNAIRSTRKAKRISQSEVAEHIGIDQGTYSRKERGDSNFEINQLEMIADFLDVELSEFFTFHNEMKKGKDNVDLKTENERAQKLLSEQIESLFESHNVTYKNVGFRYESFHLKMKGERGWNIKDFDRIINFFTGRGIEKVTWT